MAGTAAAVLLLPTAVVEAADSVCGPKVYGIYVDVDDEVKAGAEADAEVEV